MRRNLAKLELYRKFTNSLAVSVLLSIAWIGFEVIAVVLFIKKSFRLLGTRNLGETVGIVFLSIFSFHRKYAYFYHLHNPPLHPDPTPQAHAQTHIDTQNSLEQKQKQRKE